MNEIVIACDGCGAKYFGQEYDSTTKKIKGKVRPVITYVAHCINCDRPVFNEKIRWE